MIPPEASPNSYLFFPFNLEKKNPFDTAFFILLKALSFLPSNINITGAEFQL